jgi:hypothetical protein
MVVERIIDCFTMKVLSIYNDDDAYDIRPMPNGHRMVTIPQKVWYQNSAGEWMEPPINTVIDQIQRIAADGKWRSR